MLACAVLGSATFAGPLRHTRGRSRGDAVHEGSTTSMGTLPRTATAELGKASTRELGAVAFTRDFALDDLPLVRT